MKIGSLRLACMGWMLAPAIVLATAPFAWQFPLIEPADSAILRVALSPDIASELHLADGRDWLVVDADGRSVPAARLSDQRLIEQRLTHHELAFEQTLQPGDPASTGAPMILDLEHGQARLVIRSPGTAARPEDPPMVFEALIAGPASRESAQEYWLMLDFQAGQRLALDCRLREADDEGPAQQRLNLSEQGDTRPRRFRARTRLNQLATGWHLICFGEDAPIELRLVEARLQLQERIDHRQRAQMPAKAVTMNDDGDTIKLSLPGPMRLDVLRIGSPQHRVISQLQIQSRQDPARAWQHRGQLTLDSVSADHAAELVLNAGYLDQHWRLLANPPLTESPAIALTLLVDEIAFVAQGRPPWRLLIGSREAGTASMSEQLLSEVVSRHGPAWTWPQVLVAGREELAGPTALMPPPQPIPWQRYLLWAVLVFGGATVITLSWRLLRSA